MTRHVGRARLLLRRAASTVGGVACAMQASAYSIAGGYLPPAATAPLCDVRPPTPRASKSASDETTSVGITYFAGRSRRGDEAHLAAAITTELATQLRAARLTGAKARSAGSVPRSLVVRLSDAGSFVDVDFSVTGSVFREQGNVRTDVKLTRTSDGTVLWQGQRSRPISDLPLLARLVAQEVGSRVGARLSAFRPIAGGQPYVELYELLLQGTYWMSRYGPDDLSRGVAIFDSALVLDSKSRQVANLRSAAEMRLLAWGGDGGLRESRLVASGAVERVLKRTAGAAELLLERADLELRTGRPSIACAMLGQALELDPRATPAYALRSLIRARNGRIREAFSDAETVTQLGRPLWGDALRAIATTRSGDLTNGRQQARRLLVQARARRGALPFWDTRLIASALAEVGLRGEATSLIARVDARDPRLQWLRTDPLFRATVSPGRRINSPR